MSTSTASAPKDRPSVVGEARSNRAAIEIADDGPGMPIALRDRNLTTKDVGRGTGLGLSPARNIGRHGGSLTVDSRTGRTTFRVSIQISRDRAMRSPSATAAASLALVSILHVLQRKAHP